MNKILVIGSNGQLGQELKELSSLEKEYSFVFLDKSQLDISNELEVSKFFSSTSVSEYISIINASAYTAVDLAEKEVYLANSVNANGPRYLAKQTKSLGIKLIHISTDFVFDGNQSLPYKESDHKNPLSIYGKSKSLGEDYVLESNSEAVIIRTSWVYSKFGKNFVKTIHKLSQEREFLRVVDDQIGSPTWAGDLAKVCLESVRTNKKGIYHFSNEGTASWYDFASEIVQLTKCKCEVQPISSSQFPTDAKRPSFSVLSKVKFRNDYEFKNVHWKIRLQELISSESFFS